MKNTRNLTKLFFAAVVLLGCMNTSWAQSTAMGCGTVTSTGTGNTTPLVIDGFPCAAGGTAGAVNAAMEPYVSVKICAPGSTTNCQIIDHVIVDTGSTGLRIAATALSSKLQPGVSGGLPLVAGSSSGTKLTECETYVDSYVYGPVVNADVYIAGELVKSTTMQVFGSSSYTVPKTCSSQGGTQTDTTQSFGGNGLIGVSFDLADNYPLYFNCKTATGSSCSANTAYAGMPSTVSQFATDNNGVVLSLPAVGASGSTTAVVGTLMFGVSTQSNNVPAAATLPIVNLGGNTSLSGTFNTEVGGTWYSAYIDSGTDVIYFNDTANKNLKACPTSGNFDGWYCPTTVQSVPFSMANTGSTTAKGTLTYSVANASVIAGSKVIAYNNVAGSDGSSATTNSSVGFGLSTFLGHNMYILFNGMTAPGTGLGGNSSTTVTGPINGID
ncbi:DUF3443 family protein [Solimicrobium silvestre]|uniref:DUF3443 family protein n=1 Tax=Solimicrobium silvestre TaxID=2099400 RepID=A0A2S9GWR4_9BURK|nr:DUF3443 family protein [Solimicrobium silvestre]PRC92163.1 hypothetical protein S2091_3079 [Solimicrobium silvestre]